MCGGEVCTERSTVILENSDKILLLRMVNNEVANANEVQQLNNKKMEKVNETTVMKMQAVEEARQNLMRAKSVLEANKDAEANIKKSNRSM